MRQESLENLNQKSEQNGASDHVCQSVDDGREDLLARQRSQNEFLKAGGKSNITSEFGKLELVDEKKTDSKQKSAQSVDKVKEQNTRGGSVQESAGRDAEEADEEKRRGQVIQVLRDPNRAPIQAGDAQMTPMGPASRPTPSGWDAHEEDAIPPEVVLPNYGPHIPAEQRWPVSDTVKEASEANRTQIINQNRTQHSSNQTTPRRPS